MLCAMTPNETQRERARFVRTLLARHDHNQTDLGQLLGISQPAAGRKLRGLRRFDVDELVLIADTYGIDVAHLIKPPALDDVLGPVRNSAPDLLTCTFNAFPQVRRGVLTPGGPPAKSALFPSVWAA